MALTEDRVTFWFGCNMLRHAEMIRLSIMLLERAGYDLSADRPIAAAPPTITSRTRRATWPAGPFRDSTRRLKKTAGALS